MPLLNLQQRIEQLRNDRQHARAQSTLPPCRRCRPSTRRSSRSRPHSSARRGAPAAPSGLHGCGVSTPSVNDQWFGTDGGSGTTALIHFIHSPLGLRPTAVSVSGDNIEWTYSITVQPGQTLELGTFTIQANSEAGDVTEANALVSGTAFGGHAAVWLRMQMEYDLAQVEKSAAKIKVRRVLQAS